MHRSSFEATRRFSFRALVPFMSAAILPAVIVLGASVELQAATIEKVKNTQAIVAFDEGDGEPSAGEKFFATENGKRKAILEVVRFKNGKAIVKITKGKAKEGMQVVAAKPKAGDSDDPDGEAADAAEEGTKGKKKKTRTAGAATLFKDMTIGVLGGYAMDSQSVTVQGSAAQAMAGSGFSVRGFADIPVAGKLALLARGGAEQFNVLKDDYKSEILYAVLDLMLKYSFGEGSFIPFGMGGLGLHFPISKSSNILDVNRISSTTVFYGGGGFNFVMGSSSYLQVTAEYGMFPPSNDVTTSMIAVRGGLGFRF